MTHVPVRLHSWLRLQREGVPLAARADALCRALQDCPEVRRAFYLSWQPEARLYSHAGAARHFPPAALRVQRHCQPYARQTACRMPFVERLPRHWPLPKNPRA